MMIANLKPQIIVIEVTTKCNLNCKHCYINAKREGKDISMNLVLKIARELKKIKPEVIAISGGEPLLHPKIKEIIKIMRPVSEKLVLETNATLLDEKIIKFLLKNDIIVQLSLENIGKAQDENRRKRNIFKKTIYTLFKLKTLKIKTTVLVTPLFENPAIIKKLKWFSEKYKIPIGIERFIPIGRGKKLHLNQNFLELIRLGQPTLICTDPLSILNRLPIPSPKIIGCSAGIIACCISPEGYVFPCPKLRVKAGDLNHQKFKEIWFKSPLFKHLRNREKNLKFCKNCAYINNCGGCRAHAFAVYEDIFGKDPLCPIKFVRPYEKLSEFYDKIMKNFDYKQKAEFVYTIIKKENPNAKHILDLGCGTGELLKLLAKKRFIITGIDISKEMLKIAHKKIKKNKRIKLINTDIRKIKLNSKQDVVISIFDTLNYITDKRDLKKVIKKINLLLRENGIFIFDINTVNKKEKIKNIVKKFKFKNAEILWKSKIKGKIWKSFFIIKSGKKYFGEVHTERLYRISEIKDIIRDYFKIVAVYNGFSFKKANSFSERACFVLRKSRNK